MSTLLRGTNRCKTKITIMAVTLLFTCVIITALPVSADTPTLKVSADDMAPGIIYLGAPHVEGMRDIVMLAISFNTTHSEGITLSKITLHRAGSFSDALVENVKIYNDSNLNGQLDLDHDTLIGTSVFELGKAEFSVQLIVIPENPLTLFVSLSITSDAALDGTLGIEIPDETYIKTQITSDIDFDYAVRSKNSTVMLDTDGDLNPDETDADDDNDGYMDEIEIECESDPKDSSSTPKDTDKDYVPDSIDTDDDNDGVPDKYDDFPKDKDKQRDYTVVILYALIALVLIIALIFLARRKPKIIDKGGLPEDEFKDDFDIDIDEEGEEGVEGEEDNELDLDEDLE